MTATLPMVLIKLDSNETHCLAVVEYDERPSGRSIHPVEIVGQFELVDGQPNMSPESFARGKEFTDFLHATIAKHGPYVPGLQQAALHRDDTYVYVIDGRTPTPQGDVPSEDIIGSFHVRNGVIRSDAYARFPEHRLFSERGMFQLDPILLQHLLNDIQGRCGPPRMDA